VESPVGATVASPVVAKPGGRAVKMRTIAVATAYSLALAAGGGYVFYASIRPVSIDTGYMAEFAEFPWITAELLLAAVWVVGPVMLLALGIDLRRHARLTRWFVVGGLSTLAAGTAIGFLIIHDFRLLLTAYPVDLDGSPLGPSRFAPGAPYWQALMAACGELAVGNIMTALVVSLPQKGAASIPDPGC
jgi:hypothetical protein